MSSLRFDRLVSVYVCDPLLSGKRGSSGQRLPILMYHSVSDDPETGVRPYYRIATNRLRFTEQMNWLSELGYQGLSLEAALPMLAGGTLHEPQPVALTFDDGFQDFYECAWPVLQRHGFGATMYLPTGFISQARKAFRGKGCLTWSEVRELRQQGIRFGSHTVNHPKLYDLPWSEIKSETTISKEQIEQELQEEVTSFAYPYAFPQEDRGFTHRLNALLSKVGYRNCATTVVGRVQVGDDPFFLSGFRPARVTIRPYSPPNSKAPTIGSVRSNGLSAP
jgi:peptidoglycan/xylan/chitin deacetylase (PgdA/CDA1 family)